MPRDPGTGNWIPYTPGNPVVTNTTITSVWWNNTYTDLGGALQDSLSRSGAGFMQVPMEVVAGTAGAPGLSFQLEPTTGLYQSVGGQMDVTIQGTRTNRWTTALGFQATPDNGVTWVDFIYKGYPATLAATTCTATGGALGLTVASSATNIDVEKVNGYIDLSSATNPASTTGFTNRVTPKNVAKCWGLIRTNGVGGVSVLDGFNIASVSLGVTALTVTFATAMSSNLYSVPCSAHASQALAYVPSVKAVGSVQIQVMTLAAPGVPLNPNTTAFDLDLVLYGVQ